MLSTTNNSNADCCHQSSSDEDPLDFSLGGSCSKSGWNIIVKKQIKRVL